MLKRGKLMRSNLKFCRCCVPGHGQSCIVTEEMRRPGTRADDKRTYRHELHYAAIELMQP
jgi:hypothetical protein